MKVAFYSYPSAFQNPGGGEFQLLKTKEYLRNIGVDVRLFSQWEDKLEDYDILHVFGSVKDCLGLVLTAKSKKVKIALSTIFWSDYRRSIMEEGSIPKRMAMFLRQVVKSSFPYFPSARRKLMLQADILFPNGEGEAKQIERYFGIKKEKIFVVPNGCDERFKSATPEEFIKKYDIKDFILYAGRIEPRKNQLNFIKAMREIDKPIVFMGDPVSDCMGYYKKCRDLASPNMHFIGYIPHDSTLLASAYAACEVFALTSWFETPGLCALEAVLAGAKIVITDGGCAKEYFGDMAVYAKPDDIDNIRDSVKRACVSGKNGNLADHILNHYTWDKVAQITKKGYEKILKESK